MNSTEKKDLSLTIHETRLNIRSTVLLETPEGYIFEYDRFGFYYPVGGRIKLNEDSAAAAVREMKEELGLVYCADELQYLGVLEDFFDYDAESYHELNFIYLLQLDYLLALPKEFKCFKVAEIPSTDIRPAELKKIILADNPVFNRILIRELR